MLILSTLLVVVAAVTLHFVAAVLQGSHLCLFGTRFHKVLKKRLRFCSWAGTLKMTPGFLAFNTSLNSLCFIVGKEVVHLGY